MYLTKLLQCTWNIILLYERSIYKIDQKKNCFAVFNCSIEQYRHKINMKKLE